MTSVDVDVQLSSLRIDELRKDVSAVSNNGVLPLLDLPEKAQDNLLKYLSMWKLMDLRMTCKTTKKWVDDKHLDRFVLNIKSHEQMGDAAFKDSITPWRNIVILCDANISDPNWIDNPLYGTLMNKLSASITSLKMDDHRVPYSRLVTILSTCQALKIIVIGTLDCRGSLEDSRKEDATTKSLLCSRIQQLEQFSIGFLAWTEQDDLDVFKALIEDANQLEYLKAPHILMASLFQIGDTDDEEADRVYLELVKTKLSTPLVGYLKNRLNLSTSAKTSGDDSFGTATMPGSGAGIKPKPLAYLDVENLHHTEIFPAISAACFKSHTKMLNVSEAYEKPVPQDEDGHAEAIESLNGFTQYLNFNRLINLKSIALDGETSADSEIDNDSIEAELPRLKFLTFCLPDDISRNILKSFLRQKRPSVTSLTIEFQVEDILLFKLFKIPDIIENFQNLHHLALLEWQGKDDDLIIILNELTLLRSLRLQGCSKITDRGFIGENPSEPVLLKSKHLQDLWIDCQISNAVLKYAVRHMELESFYYSSDRITLVGFLSLSQGPLTQSLIKFQVMEPEDCTKEILQKFLAHFKNLKRGPIGSSSNYILTEG